MVIFWQRLIGRHKNSCKDIAKKRLQLVLIQDRLELSENELKSLKNDLIGVIAEYMPIDKMATEVNFQRRGEQMALVANIPLQAAEKFNR
ncbi:MAG: cell division topological specificity factor MinE [Bacillota bacterium]|nr:cell division topological specificity factor MinE [Bacillota bacterium]